ncbi:response regulator transcription factor [Flavobacterium urocaniciphilum]|uniref:Two component transcriptional regulator, LuxR family n=1 Tax=Flavobacterium urocaniciphilum TaxID=1299341 RepID=A0A1H9DPW5_9FLAO|nr:response regulator transcription factor [Flavobacterium urocaniciphilum]SEQ15560.1 two component transcriptional regulator, LuxR family [Flavobacterium urocaniciphilum]
MKRNILIVDDHLVVRTGVAIILKNEIEGIEISEAKSYHEALSMISNTLFDLVILDINLPDGKNTEMIAEIRSIQSNLKILMFSAHEEEYHILRFLQSGANGYLNKLCDEEIIVEAVKSILEKGEYISNDLKMKLTEVERNIELINPFYKISNREMEIVKLLVMGLGNLEISNALEIQMSTVSTYKNRVFDKLKINNLVQLIEKYNQYYS